MGSNHAVGRHPSLKSAFFCARAFAHRELAVFQRRRTALCDQTGVRTAARCHDVLRKIFGKPEYKNKLAARGAYVRSMSLTEVTAFVQAD
jgi:hypothetical protein